VNNKFEGFFDADKNPIREPSPQQFCEALAMMVSQVPDWYTKPMLRMMAHGGASKIASYIKEELENDRKPDIDIGWSAFLMLLQERLITSYDKYADNTEREMFPFSRNETDPPSDG
jgi:hypothetical protein